LQGGAGGWCWRRGSDACPQHRSAQLLPPSTTPPPVRRPRRKLPRQDARTNHSCALPSNNFSFLPTRVNASPNFRRNLTSIVQRPRIVTRRHPRNPSSSITTRSRESSTSPLVHFHAKNASPFRLLQAKAPPSSAPGILRPRADITQSHRHLATPCLARTVVPRHPLRARRLLPTPSRTRPRRPASTPRRRRSLPSSSRPSPPPSLRLGPSLRPPPPRRRPENLTSRPRVRNMSPTQTA
jgi:hypothetical protein